VDAARILVVDDDAGVREAVCEALAGLGYAAEPAGGAREALARFRPGRYGVVVTDLAMPLMDGLQLARLLRAREPGLPVVIFSAAVAPPEPELERHGLAAARKPDVDGLARLIEHALARAGGVG
jgi:CheY-like chemotaxis protein